MKKSYIIGIMVTEILAIVAGIIVIFFTNKNTKVNKTEQIAKKNENASVNIEVISTAASEEKTSPSTVFVFNTKYNSCGHENSRTIEIPEELVNKTEDEIKEKYKDYNIEKFTSNEVIFEKNVDEICDEHYMLREKDGYLAIYTIDLFGKETLKEMTHIVTSYLPETDLAKLKEGIQVVGKEELNSTIEDYE